MVKVPYANALGCIMPATEVEYMAATEAIKKPLMLKSIVNKLGISQRQIAVYYDSKVLSSWLIIMFIHRILKHIGMRIHFIRDMS